MVALIRRSLSLLLVFAGLLLPAAARPAAPPRAAGQLAAQIGFDQAVLDLVQKLAGAPVRRLVGYDENGFQVMARGAVVSVPRDRAEQVFRALRKELRPRGFLAYFVEINDAIKTDKIGVLKGLDQLDILRVMSTNGGDDVSHEDVMEQVGEWSRRYSFDIIGAENDWIWIEFRTLPSDLKAFAQEVCDFSPDAVDEGTGNAASLTKEIAATKRLLLSWE